MIINYRNYWKAHNKTGRGEMVKKEYQKPELVIYEELIDLTGNGIGNEITNEQIR